MSKKLVTAKELRQLLKVSNHVLAVAESRGLIRPFRTPGGHRRYDLAEVHRWLTESRRQHDRPDQSEGGSNVL